MRIVFSIVVSCFLMASAAQAGVLWYNGDSQGGQTNAFINFESTNFGSANTYDDFVVDTPWVVDRVWSNNSMNVTGITQASYAIRSGMSPGNGGTLVAGGIATATQTLTGRLGNPHSSEYTIEVAGLSVSLAPGRYWLSVSPLVGNAGSGVLASYNTGTLKNNAVGEPSVLNVNGFVNVPVFGFNFAASTFDYSMGVGGTSANTVVPEPTSIAIFGLGALGMLGVGRRRKQQTA